MRTRTIGIFLSGSILGAGTLATGCKWTDFDDLEKDTWVESTEKPNSNSTDYGVALTRGSRVSADGGTLIVLGAGEPLYDELQVAAAGGVKLNSVTEVRLNRQFAIGNFEAQPILIASPDSDDVAIVTKTGGASIVVLSATSLGDPGTHGIDARPIGGPTTPDAATYFRAPGRTKAEVLAGAGDAVFGVVMPPAAQPQCQLVDDMNGPVAIKGMAALHNATTDGDDLVVWTGNGKLLIYDGATAFNGCVAGTTVSPISRVVNTGFSPTKNASMHVLDDKYVVLAGHHEADNASQIAMYDLSTTVDDNPPNPPALLPTIIGIANVREGLRSSAILEVESGRFLLAGYPLGAVSGTAAGEVLAFKLTPTEGIAAVPTMTLNDAQPESNQSFGRAVTVFPYNGKPIIAVGADNEVFTYYQTPLYDETRNR